MTSITPAPKPKPRTPEKAPFKKFSSIAKPTFEEARSAAQKLRAGRKPPKRKNAKRATEEFARCFHSVERVEFVKSLPCCVTGRRGDIENAHVIRDGSEGMGRRGGYQCIAPVSREIHRLLHCSPARFTERFGNFDFAAAAKRTENAWRERAE